MVLMAGTELPLKAVREQSASAINLIVHQERMQDGSRKVVRVSEVQGMEGDVVVLQDIFVFQHTGIENRRVTGKLEPNGIQPKFMAKLEAAGIHLAPSIFGYEEKV
jgi:pilus assembly protein CpaF